MRRWGLGALNILSSMGSWSSKARIYVRFFSFYLDFGLCEELEAGRACMLREAQLEFRCKMQRSSSGVREARVSVSFSWLVRFFAAIGR